MRTRVFKVSSETWAEHIKAGVAGINDPVVLITIILYPEKDEE
jgi:hypothetical protein